MELHCPHCDALLAARISANAQAKCLACGRRFALREARPGDPGIRGFDASKSLRKQLDELTARDDVEKE